jgi:NAD(P)-dependent dehydrogenase (short-subunit alcohol dehydrogenase family)
VSKRLAIVTGGSSGIGKHLVEVLSRSGYGVAFNHVGAQGAAEDLAATLSAEGQAIMAAECDVGVKVEVDAFFEAACDWHGGAPDLLVNNAGIQTWSSLLDLSEARWDAVIQTNLKGCFLNIQAAAARMKAAGGGAIVNIGSGCNKLAFPNLVDYTASKGGIEQLTKSAAVELGPFGIRVNCVAPGAIVTERTLLEAPDFEGSWAPLTPLRRAGRPDDIADVVLFFAGPAARFVTGQTLWVDGGVFSSAHFPY